MRRTLNKTIFIIMIGAVLLSGLLIGFGFIARNSTERRSEAKQFQFQNDWQAIGDTYLRSGEGEETQIAVETFLNDMPESVREENNVVIVDKNGVIRLKANNKYLHTESGELTMAWDSYAVIFDQKNSDKHWIRLTGESIAESDSGYIRAVGYSRIGLNQPELRAMIHDYWKDVDKAEAEVEITYIGDQKDPLYLFWFMDLGVHDRVYQYLELNAGNYFLRFIYAGFIMFLLYWLLAPVWVFLDARRRQIQPLPWALLVLLTNVVGLIVYWIVQTQNGKTPLASACPACGKPVKKAYPYCPWCAVPLVKACKACGKTLEPGWVSCPWCGQRITENENAQ